MRPYLEEAGRAWCIGGGSKKEAAVIWLEGMGSSAAWEGQCGVAETREPEEAIPRPLQPCG
jgi:hypothetical protein